MHPELRHVSHRPWPLPSTPWKWQQSWVDLAFLHWRTGVRALQERLPGPLRIQEFDGSAWIGLVPFRMTGVGRRPFTRFPAFPSFPELNLRTYVECGGKPGVWFFSLDAASWPMVFGGRRLYGLPYFRASMQLERRDGWHCFQSVRRGRGKARFKARWRPAGGEFHAAAGTFEAWAAERYCLYSFRGGRLKRVDVHHAPWPLQPAELHLEHSTMLEAAGIAPASDPPVAHFSKGVHAVSFPEETVSILSSPV